MALWFQSPVRFLLEQVPQHQPESPTDFLLSGCCRNDWFPADPFLTDYFQSDWPLSDRLPAARLLPALMFLTVLMSLTVPFLQLQPMFP